MQSNPTFGIYCSITVRAAKGECLTWHMTCIVWYHANGWMIDNELTVSTLKLTQIQSELILTLLLSVSVFFGSNIPSPPSNRLLCLKCLCWQRNNSSKASCSATPAVAAAMNEKFKED
ncbi:hypothetical protein GQX74_015446 [Glossina fuscipes]|nr:hypothetical protein GQX74_015446 [Glossina fuscipes]